MVSALMVTAAPFAMYCFTSYLQRQYEGRVGLWEAEPAGNKHASTGRHLL